jgi:GrpB-like predicted nucleotidyltransferase (UPF0157 family)
VSNKPLSEAEIQAAHVGTVIPFAISITVVDSHPEWPQLFDREAARIQATLGDRVLRLEHVGSTAVPGLAAKPIIDILLGVGDSADEPRYVPDLEAAGYVLTIREPGWNEHRMFQGPDTDIHLHVFSSGSPEVARMLLFRDWLRCDASDRKLYEHAKRELAPQNWKYMQNYADAKIPIFNAILERAEAGSLPAFASNNLLDQEKAN